MGIAAGGNCTQFALLRQRSKFSGQRENISNNVFLDGRRFDVLLRGDDCRWSVALRRLGRFLREHFLQISAT